MTYRQYHAFGNPAPSLAENPLTYCLVDSADKNYLHGSTGVRYRPETKECQMFMAEKCATKWDGFCEYFYLMNRQQRPNSVNTLLTKASQIRGLQSVGKNLLENTAERKYCSYPTCELEKQAFDPNNPRSIKLNFYVDKDGNTSECVPVCRVDPETINDDPVMQRLVANPDAAPGVLVNIIRTAQRENVDLSDTILAPYLKLLEN